MRVLFLSCFVLLLTVASSKPGDDFDNLFDGLDDMDDDLEGFNDDDLKGFDDYLDQNNPSDDAGDKDDDDGAQPTTSPPAHEPSRHGVEQPAPSAELPQQKAPVLAIEPPKQDQLASADGSPAQEQPSPAVAPAVEDQPPPAVAPAVEEQPSPLAEPQPQQPTTNTPITLLPTVPISASPQLDEVASAGKPDSPAVCISEPGKTWAPDIAFKDDNSNVHLMDNIPATVEKLLQHTFGSSDTITKEAMQTALKTFETSSPIEKAYFRQLWEAVDGPCQKNVTTYEKKQFTQDIGTCHHEGSCKANPFCVGLVCLQS